MIFFFLGHGPKTERMPRSPKNSPRKSLKKRTSYKGSPKEEIVNHMDIPKCVKTYHVYKNGNTIPTRPDFVFTASGPKQAAHKAGVADSKNQATKVKKIVVERNHKRVSTRVHVLDPKKSYHPFKSEYLVRKTGTDLGHYYTVDVKLLPENTYGLFTFSTPVSFNGTKARTHIMTNEDVNLLMKSSVDKPKPSDPGEPRFWIRTDIHVSRQPDRTYVFDIRRRNTTCIGGTNLKPRIVHHRKTSPKVSPKTSPKTTPSKKSKKIGVKVYPSGPAPVRRVE